MEIRLANERDLEFFFQYLDVQLQDNGADGAVVFQPVSREDSRINDIIKAKFSNAVNKVIGEEGWRILMLAFMSENIVGHIDIRPYPNKYSNHRALLGMGVDTSHRGQGIGEQLLKSMLEWMQATTKIEHLDLWVMSDNLPAIRLYEKLGFTFCGEIKDMYRFDGKSISESMMSLSIIQQ